MSGLRVARCVLPLLLLAALFLTGCAQNVVRLGYPSAPSVVAKSGSPSICVVLFEDRRGKAEIGERRDGQSFQPQTAVDDWMSRAMADELAQAGFVVTYARTFELAKQSAPDFIVTGVIEEVWLKEPSFTSLSCSMRVTVSLLRGNGTHLFKNNFSASLNRTVIPAMDSAPKILTETLNDLLQPAAQKIEQTAR